MIRRKGRAGKCSGRLCPTCAYAQATVTPNLSPTNYDSLDGVFFSPACTGLDNSFATFISYPPIIVSNKLIIRSTTDSCSSCLYIPLLLLKCVPASKQAASPTAPGTELGRGGGGNNLLQTMGPVQESNCRGNKMTWTKSKANWEKLQLAKNLNLYQNVWQAKKVTDPAMSDITCNSFNQGALSWQTKFSMPCNPQDNNQVKTYTNVAWAGTPVAIKAAKVFTTAWDWKFTEESADLVLDVSYDIFLTKDPNCRSQDCASREVMVWLGSLGKARPAGARVPVNGSPTGTIKSGGKYEFQVWKGVVNVPVISIFPAEEGRRFTSFSGDLKKLLQSLAPFGVSQDEYILSVGAGIEIFKS
ncbi:hypothetical protein PGT21_028537 [Puccinia graminis f. sp. tritici]|uniref:Uncharacterized protein n=1 Tax=Puccinia graminis f. sp. tritici TaxID=56615 RepID=A0A5B0NW76_PUCGR|nr:hypothetical protein PGT21_028537 [Puccinia graminis f. sp. tritici]